MINNDTSTVLYGDRFVTAADINTIVMVIWAAPCTGGFECVLPKGTVLIAQRDQVYGATAFNCVPENYNEFEKRYVPASDRFALKYSGYIITISNKEIGVRLQRISRANTNILLQMMVAVLGTIIIIAALCLLFLHLFLL